MSKRRSKIELDEIPRAALVFTDESIFMSRFDERGAPTATYPVSSQAVASALNTFGSDTGLLALDTLFWQLRGGDARIGVWLAPRRRTLNYDAGKHTHAIDAPMPGLVFVGHRGTYWIWAAPRRPAAEDAPLYAAPFSNVYHDGHICVGSAPFPRCSGSTIGQAAQVFFESSFNNDLDSDRVKGQRGPLVSFWKEMRGKRAFPNDRLVEARLTAGDVMRGEHGH